MAASGHLLLDQWIVSEVKLLDYFDRTPVLIACLHWLGRTYFGLIINEKS